MTDRGSGPVLLDTHVWIWLNNGSAELSPGVVEAIDRAARKSELFIPAIAVWETAVLSARKRIVLSSSIHQWIHEALGQPGVNVAELSPEVAVESTLLPGAFHGDPADRMIVATARIHRMTLITRDAEILVYAKGGFLKALKA